MENKEFPNVAERILKSAVTGLNKWYNEQISIDDYIDQYLSSELRPPVSSMLFEYFRHKAFVDRIISSKCSRPPKPRYQRLMAVALTQCLFQNGIRPESAVNIAVNVAKDKYGKAAGGFINGVLRNVLRDGFDNYKSKLSESFFSSFPAIIKKRWEGRFDKSDLKKISDSLSKEATLIFRLTSDIDRESLDLIEAVELAEFGWAPGMKFFSTESKEIFRHDFLSEGKVYIQDPATALAPCMIEMKGDERILDMCAAPGGKTLILAERLEDEGRLVAADRSAKRQEMTRENLSCRGLDCEIIVAAADELNLAKESFDIVLADVPCTNTGVIRHKPDALWRFSQKALDDTLKLQSAILTKAAELVAPGGSIIYSTCSIEAEENQMQVEEFLRNNSNFQLIKQKILLPDLNHDGAFAAIILKK